MNRPVRLPEFGTPPLDELVLGVQFSPVPGYSSIYSGEIWELFKEDFPHVEEHPALEPQFETFGGHNARPGFQFSFGPAPTNSRMWFASEEQNDLIQFQSDRLLHNWRRGPNGMAYPRFEPIEQMYLCNLEKIRDFFRRRFSHELEITQAEIGYVNLIRVDDFSEIGKWFSIWKASQLNIEGLTTTFMEVVKDNDQRAIARLHHILQSVLTIDGKHKAYKLELTFRGLPKDKSIDGTIEFIRKGREKIVTRFTELTTDYAHQAWERLK